MYFKQLCTCINGNHGLLLLILGISALALLSTPIYALNKADTTSDETWHYAEQGIMGTLITVKLQHTDPSIAKNITKEIFSLMWDINNEMSNFKPDSLLSKINREASQKPVIISPRLFGLIEKSLYYSRLSGGAFDITVGTIKQHFNFRERKRPSESVIRDKIDSVNYRNIKLDNNNKTIFINNKDARIDLGGIAKGYAIAQAIEILKKHGIKNAYISAGGDSYALGNRNDRPWFVAIKHPRKGKNNIVLPMSNLAVSTSGDYERYFMEGDVRYHHIINPVTGHSATKSVSVTVLGESPVDTDALSTTLFVLGEKKGLELINKLDGYDAIYVYPDGKMSFSDGLQRE